MTKIRQISVLLAAAVLSGLSAAEPVQGLRLPLDLPPVLAGNFGELRPNHFHSGIDFKTQGSTGHAIRSVADGYVSRATVSPWGFGRAVYVVHPESGLTTVYGHLEAFSDDIDKRVRNEQYARETFTIDLEFAPGEIPVRKGDIIAKSGNAGSSFGPHLHFDVRDTESGDALDPLEYLPARFKDTTPPEIRQIALYPVSGKGVVPGTRLLTPKNITQGFTAWGEVYPAINAFDRMDGTANIYGVKHLSLSVDGKEIYRRTIDRFSFDATRAVNTLAHYPEVVSSGKWMMHTIVPQTCPLGKMISAENRGIITICEERPYKFVYTLTDHFGNTSKIAFTVNGRRSDIPAHKAAGFSLNYDGSHNYNVDGIKVNLPAGILYDDMEFNVSRKASPTYHSDIVSIADDGIPLAGEFSFEIPVRKDTFKNKRQYVLCRISRKGNPVAIEGEYCDGAMKGKSNRFGRFAVAADTVAPKIAPLSPAAWSKSGNVRLRISDNLSGIEQYKGKIDGKFALFELDGKSATASFRMDPRRFSRGKKHTLEFTVTDAAGNKATYKTDFRW